MCKSQVARSRKKQKWEVILLYKLKWGGWHWVCRTKRRVPRSMSSVRPQMVKMLFCNQFICMYIASHIVTRFCLKFCRLNIYELFCNSKNTEQNWTPDLNGNTLLLKRLKICWRSCFYILFWRLLPVLCVKKIPMVFIYIWGNYCKKTQEKTRGLDLNLYSTSGTII